MRVAVLLAISLLINLVQFSYVLKCENRMDKYVMVLEEFIKYIGVENANNIIRRTFNIDVEEDK